MYMNRGCWKDFFLSRRLYLYLKLSSPSGILLTVSALHAIRGYSRQSDLKGNRLPFATAPQVIRVLLANW
jgi:hypothetical protein